MELEDVIKLFRKASQRNVWGSEAYIHILNDGSGEVVSEDEEYSGDVIFEFYSPQDLIKKLEKELK